MGLEIIRGEKPGEVVSKEVDSKDSMKSTNTPQISAEEAQKNLDNLQQHLDTMLEKDLPFHSKLDEIIHLNALIIPEFFRELTNPMPSTDKSMIATNAIRAIKETGILLMKKHETEMSEDINLSSPKFQTIFMWFIELIRVVLEEQGLNTLQVNNIFNDLSLKLSGWEDRVLKRLKGISAKALDEVKNPLMEKFKTK